MEIGKFYHIELKRLAKPLYSFYPQNGWYGVVTDLDDTHVYIKYFCITHEEQHIKFGFVVRILLVDIADSILLYPEGDSNEK